jgi:hypothetical protein
MSSRFILEKGAGGGGGGGSGQGVKLNTHLHQVLRLKMCVV